MKIVFDASSLISISQTCLVRILPELKSALNAEFLITPAVFHEAVSRPMGIKRFELTAVRMDALVKQGHLELKQLDASAQKFASEISALANNIFFTGHKPIRIMQKGEIESLALIRQLDADALVVDERTTRMMVENPLALHSLMKRKYKRQIQEDRKNSTKLKGMFSGLSILRSVELIALAIEKNALAGQLENNKKALEAALFAAKFSGCAVSFSEINNFLRGV